MERRGIWAFGGSAILLAILALALFVRLDQLGRDPLGPAEACISRDFRSDPRQIPNLERREILTPLYQTPLRIWGWFSQSPRMLRLYSTVWALLLAAVVFRIGALYFSTSVGALAAVLLAVSAPLVAASHDIGPATEAAVFLMLNFGCLFRAAFRRAAGRHWALYLLTGALAIACHPLSVWIILVQAVLAFVAGPREERQNYYGRLVVHSGLLMLFAWAWFRTTRPLDPSFAADWGPPTESGLGALVRLLGVHAFWGNRILPSGWFWTLGSILVIIVPLVYGGLAIRHRQTQEMGSFLLTNAAAPVALIFLAPRRLVSANIPAADALTLIFGPLALWAAVSLRMGMRERTYRVFVTGLVGGGLIVSLWSSRVQIYPEWEIYRARLADQAQRGRPIVMDRVAWLADFEQQIGSKIALENIAIAPALGQAANKGLVVITPRSPIYRADDPPNSPAPLIRTWLDKNCRREEILSDDFFRLSAWTNFNPTALRDSLNRETFYDPKTWEALRFVRWFGPYDPAFENDWAANRVVQDASSGKMARSLLDLRNQWVLEPKLPPGYYHVFIPLQLTARAPAIGVPLVWELPNNQRKAETVAKEATGLSFIWEAASANEALKITVLSPLGKLCDEKGDPSVIFFGVGLRRHFPYVVDLGAPFDNQALGYGWHGPERDGDVTYRWTNGRARMTFYLPAAGGIGLEGELSLRVAYRPMEGGPPSVPFEVFWDGKKLEGEAVATKLWSNVRLTLPGPPAPGRHEVAIKSDVFYAPNPANPKLHLRFGLMVDKVSVE